MIKEKTANEPLAGATAVIRGTSNGAISDVNGYLEIVNIPDGKHDIVFSFVGYESLTKTYEFPLIQTDPIEILLSASISEIEEVVVSATRSSRTIDDIPTRVETISESELEEKAIMQPANVKMALTESTGIQTQQTSATSANASIRIQGLDGKYTQLLKDGLPLYSGFSGGLSIVQIPPLDLKRIEVIKGSSSTLYGGGAIAGLINFVTKAPADKKELSLMVNANNTRALDVSTFYAEKFEKIGVTLFASGNLQSAYDANIDELSDIPQFSRYSINPWVFFYLKNSATLSVGINSNFENRLGGDMVLINDNSDSLHSYFERNLTNRISSQVKFEKVYADKSILTIKNSVGYFDRNIGKPEYIFHAVQVSRFTELSYLFEKNRSEWIIGGNLWSDDFNQVNPSAFPLDNRLIIAGAFVQNSYKASEKLIMEAGLRADVNFQNRLFLLPRISVLNKITNKLSARIGGGLGYKSPSIFSEETEERGFRNIQPIDPAFVKPEQSFGGNFDINFRTPLFGKLSFSMNQLFFYTRLINPLVLSGESFPNGNNPLMTVNGFLESKGIETNLKLGYNEFAFYCGYTFIDAIRHYDTLTVVNPLTAKNRIYMTLMYEIENKLRVGYELFYTGEQWLSNGQDKPDYWVMGISAEYSFGHFSIFANAENFTDMRQTRYEQIYSGSLQEPIFSEIWAPVDGFVFNGGFKINIW
ncbi:MAG TPA: TonB-dependent receptor [Cyclobacteriaceae bacterium]|nr:TonB-dependent receptor [Cyclobacteriaceae bacterium]